MFWIVCLGRGDLGFASIGSLYNLAAHRIGCVANNICWRVLFDREEDNVKSWEKWELGFKVLAIWLMCLIVVLFVGCGYTPTQEQLDQRAYDAENWELCKQIYRDQREAWTSDHSHNKGAKHSHWDVRDDLMRNYCDQIIPQDHWAR
jgi:hypothetical protein